MGGKLLKHLNILTSMASITSMSASVKPSETQEKIISLVAKKGANLPCPRCGKNRFSPLNGYFSLPVAANPEMTQISGFSISIVAMVCENCGYLSFHDLKRLNRS
jgi:predicted nucleic-acid-binding Zn-ribbon protein